MHRLSEEQLYRVQHQTSPYKSSSNAASLNRPLQKNWYSVQKPEGKYVDGTQSLTVSSIEEYLQFPDMVDLVLDKLETVDILGTVGSGSELHFIKLLLASSPSLVWMKISKGDTIDDPREELRILGEVTQLPRASPIAKIKWN